MRWVWGGAGRGLLGPDGNEGAAASLVLVHHRTRCQKRKPVKNRSKTAKCEFRAWALWGIFWPVENGNEQMPLRHWSNGIIPVVHGTGAEANRSRLVDETRTTEHHIFAQHWPQNTHNSKVLLPVFGCEARVEKVKNCSRSMMVQPTYRPLIGVSGPVHGKAGFYSLATFSFHTSHCMCPVSELFEYSVESADAVNTNTITNGNHKIPVTRISK